MEPILELTKPLSLFERLGKNEGITLIVDEAVEAHMNNPRIKDIFTPHENDPEILAFARQQTIDFICTNSRSLNGDNLKKTPTTYMGIHLNAQQYLFVIDDILQVLEQHEVNETSKKDMLAILWSLKNGVINNN